MSQLTPTGFISMPPSQSWVFSLSLARSSPMSPFKLASRFSGSAAPLSPWPTMLGWVGGCKEVSICNASDTMPWKPTHADWVYSNASFMILSTFPFLGQIIANTPIKVSLSILRFGGSSTQPFANSFGAGGELWNGTIWFCICGGLLATLTSLHVGHILKAEGYFPGLLVICPVLQKVVNFTQGYFVVLGKAKPTARQIFVFNKVILGL